MYVIYLTVLSPRVAWIGILLWEWLFVVLSCAAERLLIPRNVFFSLWVYKKVWESAETLKNITHGTHTHTAHTHTAYTHTAHTAHSTHLAKSTR